MGRGSPMQMGINERVRGGLWRQSTSPRRSSGVPLHEMIDLGAPLPCDSESLTHRRSRTALDRTHAAGALLSFPRPRRRTNAAVQEPATSTPRRRPFNLSTGHVMGSIAFDAHPAAGQPAPFRLWRLRGPPWWRPQRRSHLGEAQWQVKRHRRPPGQSWHHGAASSKDLAALIEPDPGKPAL